MIKVTVGILSAHLMIFALALSSGALIDDFNDGNFDGWKVQAEKRSNLSIRIDSYA